MLELFIHEVRGNILSGRLVAAFFILLLALLISLGMMHQEYERRMENYTDSLSMPGRELFFDWIWYWRMEDGNTNNSNTIAFPMGKVKMPDPLIYFSRGVDKQMRQSVEFIATFPIIQPTYMPEQESNLLKVLFEAPDYLFMVKILGSLLALLFAYNLVCEERERGTLKLILISQSSRASVFLGKVLGGFFSLLVAFTTAFLVFVLSLSFFTRSDFSGDVPQRIGLIFASSLLYLAVFFALGAAVSAFTRSSAPAFILSLLFWFLFVFVLPGLSSLIAQQFVAVDSEDKLQRMKLEKAQEMERAYSEAHPGSDNSYTAGYGVVHDEIRGEIQKEMAKMDAEHQRTKNQQMLLTTMLARVSPAGSFTYLVSSFSRSGIEDLVLFRNETVRMSDEMRATLEQFFNDPELLRDFQGDGWNIGPRAKSALIGMLDMYRNVPYGKRPLGESLANSWLDFSLMFMFLIAAFLIGHVRFLFYDPR